MMKLTVVILAVCLACSSLFIYRPMQEVPGELLDSVRLDFRMAFKDVYGSEPAPEIVERAMRTCENQLKSLGTRLGRHAGEEATLTDRARQLLDTENRTLLTGAEETGPGRTEVQELVQSRASGYRLDGSQLGKTVLSDVEVLQGLNDNTEIHFPEGVFELDEDKMLAALGELDIPFPDGVVFVGSGKSRTTLRAGNLAFCRNDLFRLGFRDMTIDCNNDGLFDKRAGSLTLSLANVRIVRFDAGHGGCKVFGISGGILIHASDTDFVGGFGNRPGMGSIFSSQSDRIIGHFERCTFYGIDDELFRAVSRGDARVWMDECQFDQRFGRVENVEFLNCQFDVDRPQIDWQPDDVDGASR